ncbi:MAG: efflux RND transporter periplasmic adaptor subunit [Eubacterium sp.]|nr:efflux RND transporter periplasmic adaptor subunit [Eubacterium sp.]
MNRKCNHNRICRRVFNKAHIAFILVMAQLMMVLGGVTGCGNEKVQAPELIDPVSFAVNYRPLTKRMVGKVELMYGKVVPKEYPVFSETAAMISEINVGVGDYVEEGDVIATCDTTFIDESIENVNNEIASLQRQRNLEDNLYDTTISNLNYEREIEVYIGDEDSISAKDSEISAEGENTRYKKAVIDKKLEWKKKELSELLADKEKTIFTAPRSGYINYVKDFAKTNWVEANENIACICDYDDLYIKTEDIKTDLYRYENYKSKWTYVNGKEVIIEEYDYSNEELAYAVANKRNPFMSFVAPGVELECGCNLTLYFMEKEKKECLAVGNDSIYTENGENFVYVKNKDQNDKRQVELGDTDGLYTEVIMGLEEGEEIFYRNKVTVPIKYEVYDVELADYVEVNESDILTPAYLYSDIYISDISGTFDKIHDSGNASAGDALFAVKTDVGSGEVQEALMSITDLDSTRTNEEETYNKTRQELVDNREAAKGESDVDWGTDTDALRENMYEVERLQCQIDALDYNETYAQEEYNSNRASLQKIYNKYLLGSPRNEYIKSAKNDGFLGFAAFETGDKIDRGSFVVTEKYRGKDKEKTRIKVEARIDETGSLRFAKLGQEMIIRLEDKTWTGKCIGLNPNEADYYLFTRSAKAHATKSHAFETGGEYQFYVEVDGQMTDKEIEDAEISYKGVVVKNVVVLPSAAVYTEYTELTNKEMNFVWKLEEGQIVKEYVTLYPSKSLNGKKYIISGLEAGDKVLK